MVFSSHSIERHVADVDFEPPPALPFPTAIVYYSPSLFAALGYAFEQQLVFSGITNGAC